jgi:hypothetical protein
MKQHIVLTPAIAEKKVSIFKTEKLSGYKVIKSVNYPAKKFYTTNGLDELTSQGVTYEIKYD